MRWIYNDGGRAEAGYRGQADDCVCRAIAIATGHSYSRVYALLNHAGRLEDWPWAGIKPVLAKQSSARTGVHRRTTRRVLRRLGWDWHPTMGIGTGCRVHLRDGELPMGRLIVRCSKHIVAVIDGVIHDIDDPSRDGTRCVYGYWS